MRYFSVTALLLVFLFGGVTYASDRIILKSGKQLYGKVISQNRAEIEIHINPQRGSLKIRKEDVARIVYSTSDTAVMRPLNSKRKITTVQPDPEQPVIRIRESFTQEAESLEKQLGPLGLEPRTNGL